MMFALSCIHHKKMGFPTICGKYVKAGCDMSPEEFIKKHITDALLGEGFPAEIARGGAEYGVDYYRRCSQSTRKGSMFADCLFRARQWAIGQTTAAERNVGKKVSRRNSQGGLL